MAHVLRLFEMICRPETHEWIYRSISHSIITVSSVSSRTSQNSSEQRVQTTNIWGFLEFLVPRCRQWINWGFRLISVDWDSSHRCHQLLSDWHLGSLETKWIRLTFCCVLWALPKIIVEDQRFICSRRQLHVEDCDTYFRGDVKSPKHSWEYQDALFLNSTL